MGNLSYQIRYRCKRCNERTHVNVYPAIGFNPRKGKDRHDRQLCARCYKKETA